MAGAVFQPIVPREQYERRGVRRLDDDVGNHLLQFFDLYRAPRAGSELAVICVGFMVASVGCITTHAPCRAAYHSFGIVALSPARR